LWKGRFGRKPSIGRRISPSKFLGTAASAIWKTTWRPWLATLAPNLMSFSQKLVNDHHSAVSGIADVRMKLPGL
jgi:hypothetical protein